MTKKHVHFPNKKIEGMNKFGGLAIKFKTNLTSLQKNAGNEAALYQLRVCLKKSMSLTEFLCKAPIPDITPERHYKKFKILQKKISKTRDLQVLSKLLKKYRKPSGKAEAVFFQWLNLNKARKTKELETLVKKEKLASYLSIYKEISASLHIDNKEIVLFTKNYIADLLIDAEMDCQHMRRDFHKLRVVIKKLHFTMDLYGRLSDTLLYKMKQVEKLLGNAHDLTIGRASIKIFLKRHKLSQVAEKAIKKISTAMLKKINSDLKKAGQKCVSLLEEIKGVNINSVQ